MKRFFRDFLIYGVAGIFGKIAAVLLMPVYTGILTQEEYGAMALILLCYGVISLFASLNIHSGIARDYYEQDIQRTGLVSTGFISILTISLTVAVLLVCSRHFGWIVLSVWTGSMNGRLWSCFVACLSEVCSPICFC